MIFTVFPHQIRQAGGTTLIEFQHSTTTKTDIFKIIKETDVEDLI